MGGLMTRVFWSNCTGAATFNICAAEAGLARLERGIGTVRHYLFVVVPLFIHSISPIFVVFSLFFVVFPLFVYSIFTICL